MKGETYGADAICIFDLLSRYLLVGALQHCCPWTLARREYTEHSYNCLGTLLWSSGCAPLRCEGADAMCDVCAMCYTGATRNWQCVYSVCVELGVNVLSVTMVTLDNTSLVMARSSPRQSFGFSNWAQNRKRCLHIVGPMQIMCRRGSEVPTDTRNNVIQPSNKESYSCLLNHHFQK